MLNWIILGQFRCLDPVVIRDYPTALPTCPYGSHLMPKKINVGRVWSKALTSTWKWGPQFYPRVENMDEIQIYLQFNVTNLPQSWWSSRVCWGIVRMLAKILSDVTVVRNKPFTEPINWLLSLSTSNHNVDIMFLNVHRSLGPQKTGKTYIPNHQVSVTIWKARKCVENIRLEKARTKGKVRGKTECKSTRGCLKR